MPFCAAKLKALRESKKMSINHVAGVTGIDTKTIKRIENGKVESPRRSTFERLAIAYSNGDTDYLIKFCEVPDNDNYHASESEMANPQEHDTDAWDLQIEHSILDSAVERQTISKTSHNILNQLLDRSSKHAVSNALSRLLILGYETSSVKYPVDELSLMMETAVLYPGNAILTQCWSDLIKNMDSLANVQDLSPVLKAKGIKIMRALDQARVQNSESKLLALRSCAYWLQDVQHVLDRYIIYRQALSLILALVQDTMDTLADRRQAFWRCYPCAEALALANRAKGGE